MINEKKHKDSVFTDLFYSDQCADKNLAELYNALYGESVHSSDITRLRLDDALFMNYHNDVASSSPLGEAVKACIRNGVLKEYLERKGSEVINMLIAEYDYDTDIKVQRQESWEDGMERGLSQGLSQGRHEERVSTLNSVRSLIQNGILSMQDAVSSFHLTEEELKTIKH